jgi:hypothetical protein
VEKVAIIWGDIAMILKNLASFAIVSLIFHIFYQDLARAQAPIYNKTDHDDRSLSKTSDTFSDCEKITKKVIAPEFDVGLFSIDSNGKIQSTESNDKNTKIIFDGDKRIIERKFGDAPVLDTQIDSINYTEDGGKISGLYYEHGYREIGKLYLKSTPIKVNVAFSVDKVKNTCTLQHAEDVLHHQTLFDLENCGKLWKYEKAHPFSANCEAMVPRDPKYPSYGAVKKAKKRAPQPDDFWVGYIDKNHPTSGDENDIWDGNRHPLSQEEFNQCVAVRNMKPSAGTMCHEIGNNLYTYTSHGGFSDWENWYSTVDQYTINYFNAHPQINPQDVHFNSAVGATK